MARFFFSRFRGGSPESEEDTLYERISRSDDARAWVHQSLQGMTYDDVRTVRKFLQALVDGADAADPYSKFLDDAKRMIDEGLLTEDQVKEAADRKGLSPRAGSFVVQRWWLSTIRSIKNVMDAIPMPAAFEDMKTKVKI